MFFQKMLAVCLFAVTVAVGISMGFAMPFVAAQLGPRYQEWWAVPLETVALGATFVAFLGCLAANGHQFKACGWQTAS